MDVGMGQRRAEDGEGWRRSREEVVGGENEGASGRGSVEAIVPSQSRNYAVSTRKLNASPRVAD